MAEERAATALVGGVALLERAVTYALGNLQLVTAAALSRSTPCREWDLRTLLRHIDDSLIALHDAVEVGYVDLDPAGGASHRDPVGVLKDRACRVLGAWTNAGSRAASMSIAGCPVTGGIVTAVGAVEVAVHGWDVAEACGHPRPIPPALAEDLLELAPLFVTDTDRPARFAARVEVPPLANPSDRLVAFLGRRPF
ncbi:MAG TPA: TIGR03086 family metal-binding protein [Pilimelia sp.]|nr:TIGR03086 family metal-binding protein [Pilimelia sp.]